MRFNLSLNMLDPGGLDGMDAGFPYIPPAALHVGYLVAYVGIPVGAWVVRDFGGDDTRSPA